MKKFFAFTTIALLAVTCLFLTSLYANYEGWDDGPADMPFQDVYGYVYVTVTYDAETSIAASYHHFFLNNGAHLAVDYSYYFASWVTGPADIDPQSDGDSGRVANAEVLDSDDFSYNMAGEEGNFTISGSTDLYIEADFNHDNMPDAWDSWNTPSCFIVFRVE